MSLWEFRQAAEEHIPLWVCVLYAVVMIAAAFVLKWWGERGPKK